MAHVWEFTNQRKLNKKEFIDYFEKKVFKTIRKFEMLPKDKIFRIKKSEDLNTLTLTEVLERKFEVVSSDKQNTSADNLSSVAENIFGNLLDGKFEGVRPNDELIYPLYYHSDAEIELYAKLVGISGRKSSRDKNIQVLFDKFRNKNPDLEINVVKALSQLD
ncbi:hypothetical protein CMI41_03690 [Candidatus Pacearchaeota archaeon]|nr:hypothetical protein [Candidatus Pacearchaeota archaeon]|tara:strand:+ start:1209 stop:1694 length:486 start_codon:yes stop_codon:yes gene_type:complete